MTFLPKMNKMAAALIAGLLATLALGLAPNLRAAAMASGVGNSNLTVTLEEVRTGLFFGELSALPDGVDVASTVFSYSATSAVGNASATASTNPTGLHMDLEFLTQPNLSAEEVDDYLEDNPWPEPSPQLLVLDGSVASQAQAAANVWGDDRPSHALALAGNLTLIQIFNQSDTRYRFELEAAYSLTASASASGAYGYGFANVMFVENSSGTFAGRFAQIEAKAPPGQSGNFSGTLSLSFWSEPDTTVLVMGWSTNVAAATPEPSSTALLGLGGLALMLRRRR